MTVSTSVEQFSNRIGLYAKAMRRAPQTSVEGVAKEGARVFDRHIKAASGGDSKLSNVGKGAPVGVKVRVGLRESRWSALFTPKGPVQLLETGIKPHVITSRYQGGPRKGRGERVKAGQRLKAGVQRERAVLNTPFGYRAWVEHPGVSQAKQPKPFTKAADEVHKKAPAIAAAAVRAELRRI